MRRWMQGWNDEIFERPYIPVGQQTAGRIIEMLRNAASSSKDPQAAGGVTPDYVMKFYFIYVNERGPFTSSTRCFISNVLIKTANKSQLQILLTYSMNVSRLYIIVI